MYRGSHVISNSVLEYLEPRRKITQYQDDSNDFFYTFSRGLMSNPHWLATRLQRCLSPAIRSGLSVRPLRLQPCELLREGRNAATRTTIRSFGAFTQLRDVVAPVDGSHVVPAALKLDLLPSHCPGCGAATQTVEPQEAGYYALQQRRLTRYTDALQAQYETEGQSSPPSDPPNCQRCHDLLNHSQGVPIFHPSIKSIQAIIEESPHRHNHIYHIIDAADFPMSIIPNLQTALQLPRLRSQNRRSKTINYVRGRVAEVSFIITRADLLAPRKEQVDHLMPYLRSVLRDSLASTGRSVRLGNIRCVSAKRGWWTQEIKADIWRRGGAAWMVGKVNVGKSNLYHVVFPKGQFTHDKLLVPDLNTDSSMEDIRAADLPDSNVVTAQTLPAEDSPATEDQDPADDELTLLPPPRKETAYPAMPLISSLPGTTASPIRIPFGNSKGELIDLPGIARSTLDTYVLPEHRDSLVMKTRPRPEQLTIKPGQSLLLGGGLLRITPQTDNLVFLAVPFVPLDVHVTSTKKAEDMANGERDVKIKTIVDPDAVKDKMASAGVFELKWDVTKQRAGPLTDPCAAKLRTDQLPFTVWAADVVIEGVGWVELVAQVRKRSSASELTDKDRLSSMFSGNTESDSTTTTMAESMSETLSYPTVEIFSPEKQFVGLRPPMNAWAMGDKKPLAKWKRPSRPRQSMRSVRLSREAREG